MAHRDVFRAIKLFHNMLRAGVEPDARAYAGIIYACVRGDRVRKAEEFLREMLARGLEVDNRVCICPPVTRRSLYPKPLA